MELYLQWQTNRKSYMIYQTVPFSMILNDLLSRSRHSLTLSISEMVQDIDIVQWNTNGDLHTTYSTVSFWMTLSDLAKYSMTQSVARSLCNS